ncbi:MAG: ATP-grasp protein [Patescibacteria group bacterium]|nr:ATP-grasp protein [Patescibacteria group bacterium]
MNSRNLEYIRPLNLKSAKRIADDKLLSKRILKKAELPIPTLIAKIRTQEELESFDWSKLPDSFALKPNRGFGGEGIIVVYGKKKNAENVWIKADRSSVSVEDLKNHIRNILFGSFSLSSTPDIAFFEERIKLSKIFKPYSYRGMPDVRVIVYNGVPVMAMLRLATQASGGKANLHLGGIGCGIDMATGTTTTAIMGHQKPKIIEYLPETRLILSGIRIPYWKQILEMAVKAQKASGLGFLGADIALDRDRGPVFLELNARPGLAIQVANLSGLKRRLERVSELKIKTVEKGVRVGMDLFGGEIEEELEDISGKKVIGTVEKVKLIGKDGKEIEVEAKIDTGAYSSSIDTDLAKQLGFESVIDFFSSLDLPANFSREESRGVEEALKKSYLGKHPDLADIVVVYSSHGSSIRPKVNITFILDKIETSTQMNIAERKELEKNIIIGRKNLSKFLIDVNK